MKKIYQIHLADYPQGISYQEIAMQIQGEEVDWTEVFLLAQVEGRIYPLREIVKKDTKVQFLTIHDKLGYRAYENTVVLILLQAIQELYGSEIAKRTYVDCSTGNGLYIRLDRNTISQINVEELTLKMRELSQQKLAIIQKAIPKDEALQIFENLKMQDDIGLFRYKRTSQIHLSFLYQKEKWTLCRYLIGKTLPDTSYVKYFSLEKYENGLALLIPSYKNPLKVQEFIPSPKVFQIMCQDTIWGERLGLTDIGSLNEAIVSGRAMELILMAEAMMEKKIGDIATRIAERGNTKLVMIAGPSSSGKTTFSHRLSSQLRSHGLRPYPIAVDDYFKNRIETPRDELGNYDFECLEAINIEKFNQDMLALMKGEEVYLPCFNFKTGQSEIRAESTRLQKGDVLVIEGIHCLNDALSYRLPKDSKYKIYISALTQLNINNTNRIHTTDGRLLRRMVRDARTRGSSAQATLKMWNSVRKGEDENIFPYQESADVVFNSALVYELAVLKPYAEVLLFGIPKEAQEYVEAQRLLKFLDYFLTINAENVMGNSIIREFIGGGVFHI